MAELKFDVCIYKEKINEIVEEYYTDIYLKIKAEVIEEIKKIARFNITFDSIAEEERFIKLMDELKDGGSRIGK